MLEDVLMPQWKLFKNPNKASLAHFPLLLDIQSDLLDDLRTTVVIPLTPKRLWGAHALSRLNPVVQFNDTRYVVMTQNISGIDRKTIGDVAGDLENCRAEIIDAVGFVIGGL